MQMVLSPRCTPNKSPTACPSPKKTRPLAIASASRSVRASPPVSRAAACSIRKIKMAGRPCRPMPNEGHLDIEFVVGRGIVVDHVEFAFFTPELVVVFDDHERIAAP